MDDVEHSQRALRRLERLASLGTTLAGAAHELNNPLAAIIGFAQLLRSRPLPAEDVAVVDTILREAERTARIVRDLLQAVREEETSERRALNVNDVAGYVAGMRRYTLETNDITCTLALDTSLPRVEADRAQLEQVVLNLLLNAEQAVQPVAERDPTRAAIRVATRRDGDEVVLEVSDTGVGIAPEVLARIWEPFFTTRPASGSGLGLSVVHGIVASHGGSIAVHPTEGGGTTFVVRLPAAAEPSGAAAGGPDAPRALDVLAVDGDAHACQFVGDWLAARGHAVLSASTAGEALALLQRLPVDAIVADAATVAPAAAFVDALRRLPGLDCARVVLASADDGDHGAPGGGVLRVRKPYDLDQLRRFIEC